MLMALGSDEAACTQEAKVCPDGSTVGRTGLHCEFGPCPAYTGPTQKAPSDCERQLMCDFGMGSPMKSLFGQCRCMKPGEFDTDWMIVAAAAGGLLLFFMGRGEG